jgi:nucleoside-diphosphate-sugar epimerase
MILITGAAGFIGRAVCARLAELGLDLLGVDRGFPAPLPGRAVQGDLCDPAFVATLFEEHSFQAVVHLSSLLNTASRRDPEAAMRVNIGGSLGLLAAAARSGAPRFIYGSSISVYGTKRYEEHGEVSEEASAAPEDIYGASKRFVEIAGETDRQAGKLPFVALRISSVVGPGAVNTSSPWRSALFESLQAGGSGMVALPFPAGERLPLVHVTDVAAAISKLVTASEVREAIYNIPSENWRAWDLAEAVRSFCPRVEFTFGVSPGGGIPQAIDGRRFAGEFGFHPIPLVERLRRASIQT